VSETFLSFVVSTSFVDNSSRASTHMTKFLSCANGFLFLYESAQLCCSVLPLHVFSSAALYHVESGVPQQCKKLLES
jgi:hypothetical protein